MRKTAGAILFCMLLTVATLGTVVGIAPKKQCTGLKYCRQHIKCVTDSGYKAKCAGLKKTEVQAKKAAKDNSQSIFSKLFSSGLPKLPLEDFILSAQRALAEKLF